jgi:hypothetical protein
MPELSPATRRIDLEAHFVTASYVQALEENPGYPRYLLDKQTGARRLYYVEDVGEPLGDALLNRLLDVGEQRLAQWRPVGQPFVVKVSGS